MQLDASPVLERSPQVGRQRRRRHRPAARPLAHHPRCGGLLGRQGGRSGVEPAHRAQNLVGCLGVQNGEGLQPASCGFPQSSQVRRERTLQHGVRQVRRSGIRSIRVAHDESFEQLGVAPGKLVESGETFRGDPAAPRAALDDGTHPLSLQSLQIDPAQRGHRIGPVEQAAQSGVDDVGRAEAGDDPEPDGSGILGDALEQPHRAGPRGVDAVHEDQRGAVLGSRANLAEEPLDVGARRVEVVERRSDDVPRTVDRFSLEPPQRPALAGTRTAAQPDDPGGLARLQVAPQVVELGLPPRRWAGRQPCRASGRGLRQERGLTGGVQPGQRLARRGWPDPRIGRQHFLDPRFQSARVRFGQRRAWTVAPAYPVHESRDVAAAELERRSAVDRLPEHRTERIEIASRFRSRPVQQLGCEIGQRSCGGRFVGYLRRSVPREAEVEHDQASVEARSIADHQVRRLEVAMHHVEVVQERQGS